MSFRIDASQSFTHLPGAPIVEAVIHWRAKAIAALQPESLRGALHDRLPEYPSIGFQREIQVRAQVGADGTSDHTNRVVWDGYRCVNQDGKYVFQFTPGGLVFSRLAPYENWEAFENEARRIWGVYRDLAQPVEIERLGVRFINLVTPVAVDRLDEILKAPPQVPEQLALPATELMHQTRMDVPGYPYRLNVIQALQPPNPQTQGGHGLILDLDVFTARPMAPDDPALQVRLAEMRWLKNHVFFTLLTDKAIARFQEPLK